MNITINNYEEFFMLYADNELPAAEREAVEAFIAANPGLQQELVLFQQFKLKPDENLVFTGKQALLKQEGSSAAISMENYSSFFVLYGDDELDNQQKAAVENFVYYHPQTQAEFEMILQSRLLPDNSIVFENKHLLYRKADDDRVIPFRWWKLAVAAMILLIAGAFWLYQSAKSNQPELATNNQPAGNQQQPVFKKVTTTPVIISKEKAVQEAVAAVTQQREQPVYRPQSRQTAVVTGNSKKSRRHDTLPAVESPETTEATVAAGADKMIATTITAIKRQSPNTVEVDKDLAAARSIMDQPVIIPASNEDNQTKAHWASSTSDDNVEVLNTSVNTKNSMRGFLRKASRMIAKKTSIVDGEGNRKGILIGGFEIAVR